jgi:hypothetical protein
LHQIAGYLHTKFAGRTHDKRLDGALLGVNALEEWKAESGGFAGTGLGKGNDVVVTFEGDRDDHFLNRGWGLKSHGGDTRQEVVGDAERLECRH